MPIIQELLYAVGAHGSVAIFLSGFVYFLLLYFLFALGTIWLTKRVFPAWKRGAVIDRRVLRPNQIRKEVQRSLISIAVFAGSGVVTYQAYIHDVVSVAWTPSVTRTMIETFILFLWNEVHFYVCHRILHTRWLYRHVHRVHHESAVPTPFATYSFHWFEAAMLASVMILAMLMHEFSIYALAALPMFSLLFNAIGHANYNVFAPHGVYSASVEHATHHLKVSGNYGFYLPFLDRMLGTSL